MSLDRQILPRNFYLHTPRSTSETVRRLAMPTPAALGVRLPVISWQHYFGSFHPARIDSTPVALRCATNSLSERSMCVKSHFLS